MPAGSDGSSSIAVRPERFMKQGAAPALKKLISPEYGSSDAMSRVARLSSSLLAMSAVLTVLSAASQDSPEQMSDAKRSVAIAESTAARLPVPMPSLKIITFRPSSSPTQS